MLPCALPLIIFVALGEKRLKRERQKKKSREGEIARRAQTKKAYGIFNKHTDYTVIHHIIKIALRY